MSLFRALRHRSFALLWAGQTASRLGDSLYQVALAWWVLQKTGSSVAMGAVLIFNMTPMLIFLLVGGVMVDRFPRPWLMLVSDLMRGLLLTLASVMAFAGWLEIWHVYAISFVFGFVDAFFQPAYRATVPEVTPVEALTSANSLTSLSGQLSGIIGPAMGAAIVKLGGTPLTFALDGASFFIGGLGLLPLLKLATSPRSRQVPHGMIGDLREGLGAVLASPWLWVAIAVAGLSNITYAGPMDVALPFLIKDHLKADVSVLGWFYSLSSLGAVLAAIGLGRTTRIRRRGLKLYGAWMLVGVLVFAIGWPIGIPGVLAAAFGIGVFNSILGLIWTNSLQEYVPRNLLGRVSSVDYLGSYLLLPVGFAVGGWATQQLGPAPVFVIGGALQAALIALGLCHPQVRNFD
jgi:DHA3 family tetracycline resistance protein-like MFS transporter